MAINFNATDFYDSLIEIVGYKCGVALAHRDLKRLMKKVGAEDHASYSKNQWVRIHSESYEEIVYSLLKAFGRLEPGFSPFPSISLYHEYKNDKELYRIYRDVMSMWIEWMNVELGKVDRRQKTLDPSPLLLKVVDKHGQNGLEIIVRFLRNLNAAMVASPWGDLRPVEWKSQIELN